MSKKCVLSGLCYFYILLLVNPAWAQPASPQSAQYPAAVPGNGAWTWTREGSIGDAGRFVGRDTMNVYGPNSHRTYTMNWTGNRPPNVYGQQYPRYPQTSAQPPYLEVQASETAPYVQQTIIYTFRIVSSGNLQSVNPILPSHESITLKKIDGPIPTSRHHGGRQEIVNEFRYELTVLRSGEISIPPLRITGTRMPSRQTYSFGRGPTYQGESFDVTAKGPLVLQVKSAHSSVRPWLPLHDLHIEGKVDSQQVIQPGKPLSLSISMTAEGGAADHIPSLESQLKAAGFRIYKESIKTRDTISADGKRLVGHREEVYTLVPVRVTSLKLAPVRLAWWNVDKHERAATVFTLGGGAMASSAAEGAGAIAAAGVAAVASLERGLTSQAQREGFLPPFWMVLLIIFSASFLVWFWLWSRGRPVGDKLRQWVKPGFNSVAAVVPGRLQRLTGVFSLGTRWQNLRQRLIMAMPTPFKIWFCARCLDEEGRPSDWCQMFKFLACKHLKISQQVTLSKIADEIIEVHPGVEPVTMRRLMRDLRAAVYGGEPLDFEAWKRDFKRQIKPVWWRRKKGSGEASRGLPELNPHSR